MILLIVDDHAILRAGLRRLFADDSRFEIIEAASGEEGWRLWRSMRPGLVILDLDMPGMGGFELIRRMRIDDPEARILVLSMHDDTFHAGRALQEGALGYVGKSSGPAEILTAVDRLLAGQGHVEPELAQRLLFERLGGSEDAIDRLPIRDLEILRLLSDGRNLHEIAAAVGVSYKTVANNCVRIKAALGAANTADLVRIAIRRGITGSGRGHITPLSG